MKSWARQKHRKEGIILYISAWNEWKELTLDECLAALGDGERARAFYRVKRAQMTVQKFEEIRATCSTLDGAETVGGWWRLTVNKKE